MKLALAFLLALSAHAAVMRIQCGGPGGTDSAGNVWAPDGYFAGGARWDVTNQASMSTMALPYNTLRYSANPPGSQFGYVIALPPTTASYRVVLKFVEPNKTGPGQRKFSVSVNGAVVIHDLDLFAAAGALKPYDVPLTITAGGQIQIVLTPSLGNAVISAIQVEDMTPPPLPGVAYLTGSEASPPPCPTAGITLLFSNEGHLFWCARGGQWITIGDGPLCISGCIQVPVADNWDMGFHDARHTGTTAEVIKPPLIVAWTWEDPYDYDNWFYTSGVIGWGTPTNLKTQARFWLPLYHDGKVCFQGGLNANRLWCLNASDGGTAWEGDTGYTASKDYLFQFDNYPAIAGGRVVFVSSDFTTSVALDGTDSKNIYNTNGGWPYGGVAASGAAAYEEFNQTDDGHQFIGIIPNPAQIGPGSMDGVNGWNTASNGLSQDLHVPAVDGGILYAHYLGQIQAWDAVTHASLWAWGTNEVSTSPAVANGIVYAYSSTLQGLVALKSTNGVASVLWMAPILGLYSPIVSGGIVYTGNGNTFYALDATTGSVKWKFPTQQSELQLPAISGGMIYVPGLDGILYALDKVTGIEVWRYTGTKPFGPVAVGGGMVYTSDLNGILYAFSQGTRTPSTINPDSSSTSAAYDNAIPIPWAHTVGTCANRLLLVAVGSYVATQEATLPTAVTYAGTALSQVPGGASISTAGNASSLWFLANPPSGTNNIAVTVPPIYGAAEAYSFCGVDQIRPIGAVHASQGNSASPTNAITPTVDGAYVIEAIDITFGSSPYWIPSRGGWATAIHPKGARAAMTWRGPVLGGVAVSDTWKLDSNYPYADVMVALNPAK